LSVAEPKYNFPAAFAMIANPVVDVDLAAGADVLGAEDVDILDSEEADVSGGVVVYGVVLGAEEL
jgi:hypothetical protein